MRFLQLFFVSLLTISCVVSKPQGINADAPMAQSYLHTAVQVLVSDPLGRFMGRGSGTVIQSKNDVLVVLTAKHVVEDPRSSELVVKVVIKGVVSESATKLYIHEGRDAAILVIPHKAKETSSRLCLDLNPLTLVVTAGFPIQDDLIITQGLLNFRSSSDPNLWICTADIAPGNSGAGIFIKETGEIVGISIAVAVYPTGFGKQLITYMHLIQPVRDINVWIQTILLAN